jgi:hypothetical protein
MQLQEVWHCHDADLYLDTISGFLEDKVFKRQFALGNFTATFEPASAAQRLEPFSKVRRYGARLVSQLLSPKIGGYIFDNSTYYKPELLQLPRRKTVYIEGYWQSPRYFIESSLRNDFKIIPPGDKLNLEMAERIGTLPSTSVHMRFFDLEDQEHSQTKEQDYSKATAALIERCGRSHFYVFSDDPTRAEQVAKCIWHEDFTIVNINEQNHSAYADMWLMSLCDHNIIADSTFSWWGAWFNSSPNRVVLAPKRSLSGRDEAWKTESLIPSDWILI